MKYILPIMILPLVLLGCSIDENEEDSAITITELDGSWKTACVSQSDDNESKIETFTISGSSLAIKNEKFSGTSCATAYYQEDDAHTSFSYGDAVTFMSGNTGRYFKLTFGTKKYTPKSAEAVSSFNSSSKCNASDWELNTEKDCTSGQGTIYYGLYQLNGNNWYPAVSVSGYPTSVDTSTENTYVKQ